MKQKSLRHPLSTFVILMAMVACVLPGQAPQSVPASAPSSINIETAVAGTSQAAAQQTEQANVIPATATAIPTNTSAPEVISSYGTSLVKRADGSTQFRDYRSGVQILFPPNWLAVRAGEPEYYEAWEKQGSQSQWFLEEIGSIQNLDLDVFRVTAYDTHPEHVLYDVYPKINVVFQQGDIRTLKEVEADEKTMIKRSVRKGDTFLSSEFRETPGGVQILLFQEQWVSSTHNGEEITTHYVGTIFTVPAGLVFIDFFIHSEQKEALLPEYNQILESITSFIP